MFSDLRRSTLWIVRGKKKAKFASFIWMTLATNVGWNIVTMKVSPQELRR